MNSTLEQSTQPFRAIGWVALATGLILLIPWVAMQFTDEVNWDAMDFLVMGVLLFATGNLLVQVARRTSARHRWWIGGLIIAAFLWIWAELAVGVFTRLGS